MIRHGIAHFVLAALILTGCSSTKTVALSDTPTIVRLNERASRRESTVVTRADVWHRALSLRVGSDSTS
jgi:uncharacterized protein YcfL